MLILLSIIMTVPNNSDLDFKNKMRKIATSFVIAQISFGLTATVWTAFQIYAYIRFHEVPFVGWEFVLLTLGLLVFTSQKRAAIQKEVDEKSKVHQNPTS